ncbi:hypothetical protein CEE37_07225 [candidate division LCP-89 bacterium B3_LCP]|uniref:Secretion system C-terminal sorting domain-containing protein n=1 Tax=candidate division LCP-89 bacterium B3_LCP TaxID=2012998 RepID=A0A532V0Q4_UNCL8|nr:MAG: hypothetical protein CEE37_07225 [candidate division LCP-89 bacterium B3_LCP]
MRPGTALSKPLLLIITILICAGFLNYSAQAIWHNELNETFPGDPPDWPWPNWLLSPYPPPSPPYTWGITDYIFGPGSNDQSLWCVGLLSSLDPEFDPYPANTNSWAFWGPIDLTEASTARSSFYYFCLSEPSQDYFAWGVAHNGSFYEAGRTSGYMSDWTYTSYGLDSLEGGTVSVIGEENVWIYFNFVSDYDGQVDLGAFIDNVGFSWDDGFYDFEALSPFLASPDSMQIGGTVADDTIRFGLNWKASGAGVTPLIDIECWLDGNLFYSERRTVNIGLSQMVWLETYTDTWVVTPSEHTVEWMLDAAFEVLESNENNNDTSMTFSANVPPWIEVTRPVDGDSATTEFLIEWEDEDPDDNATITLFYDYDDSGFDGDAIWGAFVIEEDDTTDSFLWDLAQMVDSTYWIYAYITDGVSEMYDYSEGPLVVDRTPPPNAIPGIDLLHPILGDTAVIDFLITWTDEDPDDNAEISLYWDSQNSGFDGELIVSGILEDDTTNSYLWDVTQIPEDSVWVYGEIADDDTSIFAYSDGPLIIIDTPPEITITHPATGDSAESEFTIFWEDDDPDDNAVISLFWDEDDTGFDGTQIVGAEAIEEDDTADSLLWDVSSLPDGAVWVYASIADEDTAVWIYSPGPLIIESTQGIISGFDPLTTPVEFTLKSVYPNPFNSSTQILIGLPHPDLVSVRVYDSMGRLSDELMAGWLPAGYHQVTWSPRDLPSGIYLIELTAPEGSQRAKVVFLK